MTPAAVIRPQPGCDATVAALRNARMEAHGFPLFIVEPVTWNPPPADEIDALLLGSANALRHGGPGLARWTGRPAYAVGETTAAAAHDAGLDVVATGAGGLQGLLDRLEPSHRRLLRLCGEARTVLTPPPGVTITERIVYASRPQPMPAALAAMLTVPALVLLHSAEAARYFSAECSRCAVERGAVSLAAIGHRVAAAAGPGWARVEAAEAPSDAALLALAARMCH